MERRSWLFLPANEERFRTKVDSLPADVFVFDLEDSVFHTAKNTARATLRLIQGIPIPLEKLAIRVNHLATAWGKEDIREAIKCGFRHIVYPKTSCSQDIQILQEFVKSQLQHPSEDFEITPIVETLSGLQRVDEIVTASPRTQFVIFGSEDFLADCRIAERGFVQENLMLSHALIRILTGCAAHDKYVIDCACPVFRSKEELEGFQEECLFAAKLGAIGKLAIHPNQLSIINNAFQLPFRVDTIEFLRAIESIVDLMLAQDKSVVSVNGRLVGVPEIRKFYRQIMTYVLFYGDSPEISTVLRKLETLLGNT